MVEDKVSHLLQVLKDVSEDELVNKLSKIRENNNTHISHLFLEEYFHNKDVHIPLEVYRYEAQCIVNIFPQYSVEYITSMLETLGSENNRVIIILRQLLKNEPIKNLVALKGSGNTRNQKVPGSTRGNSINTFSQPSSSCEVAQVHYLPNITNVALNIKQDSALQKRKGISTQSELLNIKVQRTEAAYSVEGKQTFSMPLNNYSNVNEAATSVKEHDPGFSQNKLYPHIALKKILYPFEKPPHINIINNMQPKSNRLHDFEFPRDYSTMESAPSFPQELLNRNTNSTFKGDSKKPVSEIKEIDQDWWNILPLSTSNEPVLEQNQIMSSNTGPNNTNTLPQNPEPALNQELDLSSSAQNHTNWIVPTTTNDSGVNDIESAIPPRNTVPTIQPAVIASNTKSETEDAPNDMQAVHVREANADNSLDSLGEADDYLAADILDPDDPMLEISSGDEDEDFPDFDIYYDKPTTSDHASTSSSNVDDKLVSKIMEIFPDALPSYIRTLCAGKMATTNDIDAVVQLLLSNEDYPKRSQKEPSPDPELDLEEQVALLKDILPDADPNYLQYHAELYLNDKNKLKEFMSTALELKNYPTLKEYIRKQQISAQVKQYTTDFDVEKFLEIIPDPDTYFNDPNKKPLLYEANKNYILCLHYATRFLKNQYPNIAIRTINFVMANHKNNLTAIVKELDSYVETKKYLMKSRRKAVKIDSTIQHIPLLQEIAYLSHRSEIKLYLEEKKAKEKQEKELAKQNGLVRTCNCCFDDEVMPKNIVKCENGCDFCNNCVKTSVEILFGEGKLDYPCLQSCSAFFSLQTLKDVLSPKLFSKMAQRKQLEEVKAAGIEELEMCPFCDFATIPAPGDKIFRCLNSDCMKESCRQCKEPSHVPLRCDEIEKDDDVKKRTYIENKMTEALLRVCYKCGMKFIKADGCNKMTCSCGARMCYVCGQPVTDYTHFNGQGGDKYHLCPLYSNTNKLHQDAVLKGAEEAKMEIGVADDPKKLKIDPTADLIHYYETKKSKFDVNIPLNILERNRNLLNMNGRIVGALADGRPIPVNARRRRHHHHHHHRFHHHRHENGNNGLE